MTKVYADKKFSDYTSIKEFSAPAELKNDPIFADANFQNILSQGDSLVEESGNGDAGDFLEEDMNDMNAPEIIVDTNKNKEKKKEEKKENKIPAPLTIVDNKKTLPKPKPKPGETDY